MTFRKWTNAYGGTYATIMIVAIVVATVVTGEFANHPLWSHLLVGLPLLFVVHFTLSAIAWQFTERRRRKSDGHVQSQKK